MSHDQLPRQAVPVRRVHLETPASYFKRLCAANSVDRQWMETVVRQRRRSGGRGAVELGIVITELGGPEPGSFESAHEWALVGHRNTRGPWDKQSTSRTACLSCTAGTPVTTYPHIRFTFCRRHRQWLGQLQRPGILDAELWKAEHALRRLVRSGRLNRALYDGAWDAVRDHFYMVAESSRSARFQRALDHPGFTVGTDDRIALFPETVRIIQVLTNPGVIAIALERNRPHRGVRHELMNRLDWIDDDRWLLVNRLHELFRFTRPWAIPFGHLGIDCC